MSRDAIETIVLGQLRRSWAEAGHWTLRQLYNAMKGTRDHEKKLWADQYSATQVAIVKAFGGKIDVEKFLHGGQDQEFTTEHLEALKRNSIRFLKKHGKPQSVIDREAARWDQKIQQNG